jgi:hypothetical protein
MLRVAKTPRFLACFLIVKNPGPVPAQRIYRRYARTDPRTLST